MPEDTLRILDTGTRPVELGDADVELRHYPALKRRPVDFDTADVIAALNAPHHIVFYSRYAVGVVDQAGVIADPGRHQFWAVGRRTGAAIAEHFSVDAAIPDDQRFDGIAAALSASDAPRPIMAFGLRGKPRDLSAAARQWDVDFTAVPVYESTATDGVGLAGLFDTFRPHWLTVTSSRGVEAIVEGLGADLFRQLQSENAQVSMPGPPKFVGGDKLRTLQSSGELRIGAIGPSTAETLDTIGLRADIIPSAPDRRQLLDAVIQSSA